MVRSLALRPGSPRHIALGSDAQDMGVGRSDASFRASGTGMAGLHLEALGLGKLDGPRMDGLHGDNVDLIRKRGLGTHAGGLLGGGPVPGGWQRSSALLV